MREILIKISIDDETGEIQSAMKHKGYTEKDYSLQYIFQLVGILENLKQQTLNKLKNNNLQ
jgi:hypothetical protein